MYHDTTATPNLAKAEAGMYEFKFGTYISDAFSIVTRNIGPFIGFAVIWGLIYFALQFIIPVFGPLAYGVIVGPCLTAGLYIAAEKSSDGSYFDFGWFFKGFDQIGPLALASLIQGLLMLAALIPVMVVGIFGFISMEGYSGSGDSVWVLSIVILLLCLPVFYLAVAWMFTPLFIVFYKMEAWKAMEASRKVVNANWLSFFALVLVAALLFSAGFLALGVGILITAPASALIVYTAFRDIVGLPEVEGERDMISHLVE